MKCPKCGAISGDDWKQCKGSCPMPGSPHYDPPEPNENVLEGIACPNCGNTGFFHITVTTEVKFSDNGAEDNGDLEFEDSSPCRCDECNHSGTVQDFRSKT